MRHSPIVLFVLAALATNAAAAAPRPSAEAERGRALYGRLGCWSCHGTVGQGGAGPRLAPEPRPLTFLTAYVRNPAGDMPPITERLASDADLAAIHSYLTSIQPPKGGPRP